MKLLNLKISSLNKNEIINELKLEEKNEKDIEYLYLDIKFERNLIINSIIYSLYGEKRGDYIKNNNLYIEIKFSINNEIFEIKKDYLNHTLILPNLNEINGEIQVINKIQDIIKLDKKQFLDFINNLECKLKKFLFSNLENRISIFNEFIELNNKNLNNIKEFKELEKEYENLLENYQYNILKNNEKNKLELEILELKNLEKIFINKEFDAIKLKEINNGKDKIIEEIKFKKNYRQELISYKDELLKEIEINKNKRIKIEKKLVNKKNKLKNVEELIDLINLKNKYLNNIEELNEKCISVERTYKRFRKDYMEFEDMYNREQVGLLALSLKEGEECPVCGSKEHPKKAEINNQIKNITYEELKNKKEKLKKKELLRDKIFIEFKEISKEKENLDIKIKKNIKDILNTDEEHNLKIEIAIEKLMETLKVRIIELEEESDDLASTWNKIYTTDRIEKIVKEINDIAIEIEENEKVLNEIDSKIESIVKEINNYKIPKEISSKENLYRIIYEKETNLSLSSENFENIKLKTDSLNKKIFISYFQIIIESIITLSK